MRFEKSHSTFCKGTNTEGTHKMLAYRCYKSDNSGKKKKNHSILLAKTDRIVFNFPLICIHCSDLDRILVSCVSHWPPIVIDDDLKFWCLSYLPKCWITCISYHTQIMPCKGLSFRIFYMLHRHFTHWGISPSLFTLCILKCHIMLIILMFPIQD